MTSTRASYLRAYDQLAFGVTRVRSYLVAKRRFSRFGARPVIRGSFRCRVGGAAVVGDRFVAEGMIATISLKALPGAVLTIGDDVYLNGGVSIEASHDIRIGSNVLIAPYASVIDDDAHLLQPGSRPGKGPTVIGDNVWLGRNAVVLPGVTIGDGSVVGANSVVTKDIPPRCFAAGAPAQVVRKLEMAEDWVRR
jgi:maltose O-acetyltransferase